MMRIFLSYALDDSEVADNITSALISNGHAVYQNPGGIVGGTNWQIDSKFKIRKSDLFILIATDESKSWYVTRYQLDLAVQFELPLLSILTLLGSPDLTKNEEIQQWLSSFKPVLGEADYHYTTVNIPLLGQTIASHVAEYNDTSASSQAMPVEPETSTKRIFIAYSHTQQYLAAHITDFLTDHDVLVFYDIRIRVGEFWRKRIQTELDRATHVVIIWTSDASQSREVTFEVDYAVEKEKEIFLILGDEETERPYHLRGFQYIPLHDDLSKTEELLLNAILQPSDGEDIEQ